MRAPRAALAPPAMNAAAEMEACCRALLCCEYAAGAFVQRRGSPPHVSLTFFQADFASRPNTVPIASPVTPRPARESPRTRRVPNSEVDTTGGGSAGGVLAAGWDTLLGKTKRS